ncbi:MAG: ABC transporter substrate-binding protein [Clostridia bacterium]|nr:ABC transporter substrate-binding protein [Clostridia bacterium]
MKRFFAFILLISALLLFSCGERNNDSSSSEKGKTAVLFSSLAQVWLEAGGSIDITVGETTKRGFAPEGTLLVDDGAGKTINTELLLSYKPSLVICSSDIPAQAEVADILEKNGIEVIRLHIESFEDYLSALDIMTDITGNKAAYENAVNKLGASIRALLQSEEVKAISGTEILFVRAGSTASSTKSKTSEDHFAAAMLSEFGCINIADGAPVSELGMEAILASDPEYIFFSLMGDEESARANVESLLASEAWSALTAVKEGKAVILPKELFHFKPCSRWGEAYEYLADILTGEE